MTGDDLKRVQENFLETSKEILLETGRLHPIGFVITLHKHLDKLFESGWGIEFLDPKACLRDVQSNGDDVTALVVDLLMDPKRLYHAVLNVFPKTRDVLPQMIALGKSIDVDDAYMRVMRAFLQATQMNEKDIIAATMRQICGQVDAFACILHSEAWLRKIDRRSEDADQVMKDADAKGLGQDQKSIEVIFSSMETYDFTRMITVPVHREASKKRDGGKVLSFGDPTVVPDRLEGRLAGFLKPLPVAS